MLNFTPSIVSLIYMLIHTNFQYMLFKTRVGVLYAMENARPSVLYCYVKTVRSSGALILKRARYLIQSTRWNVVS